MVQAEPHLSLTVDALSTSGAPLTLEQQGALAYSLPLKKVESGLDTLYIWGRVLTRNGKDYIVAEGYNNAFVYKGEIRMELKHFYSQDGVNWADLDDLTAEEAAVAERVNTQFSGDPAKVYEVNADGVEVIVKEGEDAPADEGAEQGMQSVTELKRLKYLAVTVTRDCGVVPVGAFVENSENNVIPNLSFRGIKFPEKLESYIHFVPGPSANAVLSKDPRGTWTVRYDELLGRAMVRSLVWLGYTFYFDSRTLNFGGMYVGTGVRNNDLIFML